MVNLLVPRTIVYRAGNSEPSLLELVLSDYFEWENDWLQEQNIIPSAVGVPCDKFEHILDDRYASGSPPLCLVSSHF